MEEVARTGQNSTDCHSDIINLKKFKKLIDILLNIVGVFDIRVLNKFSITEANEFFRQSIGTTYLHSWIPKTLLKVEHRGSFLDICVWNLDANSCTYMIGINLIIIQFEMWAKLL